VEGATLGGQILITPSTYEQVKDLVVVRGVRPVRFKGIEEDIDLYDVVGIKGPYNLVLPDRLDYADPLEKPIPVILHKMHDKKTESSGLSGELTHFSAQWATVIVDEEIAPLQEVRIDFAGDGDEDRIYLYAKVATAARQDDRHSHSTQITYLTPMVTQFIDGFS
jgi:adenylate cyclase